MRIPVVGLVQSIRSSLRSSIITVSGLFAPTQICGLELIAQVTTLRVTSPTQSVFSFLYTPWSDCIRAATVSIGLFSSIITCCCSLPIVTSPARFGQEHYYYSPHCCLSMQYDSTLAPRSSKHTSSHIYLLAL